MTSFKKLFWLGACVAPILFVLGWGVKKLMVPKITMGHAEQQLLLEEMNFTTEYTKHTLPALRFTLDHGGQSQTHTLADFKGKPTIVHIWATWCGACLREYAGFDQFAKKHKNQFHIISLNIDITDHKVDAMNNVGKFLKDNKFTDLPIIYDHNKAQFARTFTVSGTPCTILINDQGREIGRFNGAVFWDDPEFLFSLHELIKQNQNHA